MDRDGRIKRLQSLSPRQREVFRLFCNGSDYTSIAERLVITEGGVRAHMVNIYAKLGLLELKQQERWKEIFQNYCPLVDELGFAEATGGSDEVEEPEEVITEKVKKILDEDQHALVPIEPIVIKPPTNGNGGGDERPPCLLVIIGVLAVITLTVLALNWLGFFGVVSAQVSPTATTEVVAVLEDTPEPSDTPMPPPTETVTATITPTATLPPPPTATPFPLPFTDNFDSGAKLEWEVVVGNWRMVDGAYTADDINDWNVSLVGGEEWRDVVIDVDAITDNWNYTMRVIVRAYQGQYLVMETNCCWTRLILIVDGEERVIAQSETGGLTGSVYWHTNHIRIEARGNIYTVFVDGIKFLTAQDNTFVSGRVGLSLDYEDARFDNFSVQQLN